MFMLSLFLFTIDDFAGSAQRRLQLSSNRRNWQLDVSSARSTAPATTSACCLCVMFRAPAINRLRLQPGLTRTNLVESMLCNIYFDGMGRTEHQHANAIGLGDPMSALGH